MPKDPNTVIKPIDSTKKSFYTDPPRNGRFRRRLFEILFTAFIGSQGWLFYQSFVAKSDRSSTNTSLIRIEQKIDTHINWGEKENDKNIAKFNIYENRLDALENNSIKDRLELELLVEKSHNTD